MKTRFTYQSNNTTYSVIDTYTNETIITHHNKVETESLTLFLNQLIQEYNDLDKLFRKETIKNIRLTNYLIYKDYKLKNIKEIMNNPLYD